jgi:hypothetical protein
MSPGKARTPTRSGWKREQNQPEDENAKLQDARRVSLDGRERPSPGEDQFIAGDIIEAGKVVSTDPVRRSHHSMQNLTNKTDAHMVLPGDLPGNNASA